MSASGWLGDETRLRHVTHEVVCPIVEPFSEYHRFPFLCPRFQRANEFKRTSRNGRLILLQRTSAESLIPRAPAMEMLFGVHDTNERQLNSVAEQASDVFLHMGELGRQKNRSMTGRIGENARGPLEKVDPAPMTGVTAEGLHMDISFGPGRYRRKNESGLV